MTIKINHSNKLSGKTSANLVLFTNENFNISNLKRYISNSEFSYINDLLKNSDLKKNQLYFEIQSFLLQSINKYIMAYQVFIKTLTEK